MLRWMFVFILLVVGLGIFALNGGVGPELGMTSSLVFGLLLAVSALALILRSRT